MKKILFTLAMLIFCATVFAQNYNYKSLYSPANSVYTSSSCDIDAGKEAYFKPTQSSTEYSGFKFNLSAKVSGLQIIVYNKSNKVVNTVTMPSNVSKFDVSVAAANGVVGKIGLKNTGSSKVTLKAPTVMFVKRKVSSNVKGILSYFSIGNAYPDASTATISDAPSGSTGTVTATFAAGQEVGWGVPHDISAFKAFVVTLDAAATTKYIVSLNYKNGSKTSSDTCWISKGKTTGVVRITSNDRAYLESVKIKAEAAASAVKIKAPFLLSNQTFTVAGGQVTDAGIATSWTTPGEAGECSLTELYDLSAQTMTTATYTVPNSTSQTVVCDFNFNDRFFLWNYPTKRNFMKVTNSTSSNVFYSVDYVVVKFKNALSLGTDDYIRLSIAPSATMTDFWSTESTVRNGQVVVLDVANAKNSAGTKITQVQRSSVQWIKLMKHLKGTGITVVDAYCVLSSIGYQGIDELEADDLEVVSTEFYSVKGQKLEVPSPEGVTLVKKTYSDGSVKTTKVYGCRF